MRKITYIITQDESGKTIERFLKSKGFSSAVITDLKKTEQGVLLNETPVFVVQKVNCGDVLSVTICDEYPSLNIVEQNLDYRVVYEDEDYLIYDKPAGVVVHPTKVYQTETLGNDFAYRCKASGQNAVFRPTYRIDRNTSGLVVIAKNKLSAATRFDKEYLCICNGKLAGEGRFDQPIGLCDGSKIKRIVRDDGQPSVTLYSAISYNNGFTLASVKLLTGRTHQIRTHFSCNGFALAGDTLYGDGNEGIERHALHCHFVAFKHIVTGEEVAIKSQMPVDMQNFLKKYDISY